LGSLFEFRRWNGRDRSQVADQVRSDRVHPLHHRGVVRRLWLLGEDVGDELLLVVKLQGWIESLLVPDRAGGNRSQSLAAGASRTMRRPDLQMIWKLVEAAHRVIELPRSHFGAADDARRRFQQVRPS